MNIALLLAFWDYISKKDQVIVKFFRFIIPLCDGFLFFYVIVTCARLIWDINWA
jgi:hypothetical protein